MDRKCKVTYLKHSGFLVEMEKEYLLFDYWKGKLPDLSSGKDLYVFVSHAHHDHYSREIYKLADRCRQVRYILSDDIRQEDDGWKNLKDVIFMKEHERKTVGECAVETLLSTDQGVAYLIRLHDLTIYHAGDLHWWEWPGEPEEDNKTYIRAYLQEIRRIAGRKIDLAFVVLDPRQEEAGGRGMDTFLKEVGASYVFPMHVWEKYGIIHKYIEENQSKYESSRIMDINKPGQTYEIVFAQE